MVKLRALKQEDQSFLKAREGEAIQLLKIIENEAGALNKVRWSGWTLLHRAAEQGHTRICEILVDRGANVNSRSTWGWYTPLHLSLANGWVETSIFLVKQAGANLHAKSKHGETPCEYACKRGYREVALEFQDKMLRFEMVKVMRDRQEKQGARLQGDANG